MATGIISSKCYNNTFLSIRNHGILIHEILIHEILTHIIRTMTNAVSTRKEDKTGARYLHVTSVDDIPAYSKRAYLTCFWENITCQLKYFYSYYTSDSTGS